MAQFVGVAGSLRSESYSQQVLNLVAQRVKVLGGEVEILDLRTMMLPFCNGDSDYSDNANVERLQTAFSQADGIILVTPEYHGSVSGVLKNVLDLMCFDQLSGKVAGIISVLGGQSSNNALNDLRTILRAVHTWVIPEQIAIAQAWQVFSSDGKLQDKELSQRFDHFAKSLVESTAKLRSVTQAQN